MITTILGGGFGLYGYLPAALANGDTVVLPERYQESLRRRPELRQLEHAVRWAPTDAHAIAGAERLVIARRPADQMRLLQSAPLAHVQSLVLEKPLAPSPLEAEQLVAALDARALPFRVGYTLAECTWMSTLRDALAGGTPVALTWAFRAHHHTHTRQTWKRDTSAGGGAGRFFGIQLLAAVTRCHTSSLDVVHARTLHDEQGTAVSWEATLEDQAGRSVALRVETNAVQSRFVLAAGGAERLHQRTPFRASNTIDAPDVRIPLLRRILAESPTADDLAWTHRTHTAWLQAEAWEASIMDTISSNGSAPLASA